MAEGTYTSKDIHYTTTTGRIDYFELKEEMFKSNPGSGTIPLDFDIDIKYVPLTAGQYLDIKGGLPHVDLKEPDTTVFNFQPGSGKSHALFDIIKEYTTHLSEQYVVFYCAPFLRLIGEIQESLKTRSVSSFNCTNINKGSGKPGSPTVEGVKERVQLMTPEFLLGSGGKKFAKQLLQKKGYKEDLAAHLRQHQRKIILIVDEIHENTPVFDSQRLPHLMHQWSGLVHKVFIATATFTRDSTEVVKSLSYLTGQRIRIFQSDRILIPDPAKLHLHLCQGTDSADYSMYYPGLARIVKESREAGKVVHLLTAHKTVADYLTKDLKGKVTAAEEIRLLAPKRLVGSTDTAFDQEVNSIGTAFKTGVNITNPNTALIVVLPAPEMRGGKEQKLGIFTGLLTSVTQAFARMRKGGAVHVFMPPFATFIDMGTGTGNRTCRDILRQVVPGGSPIGVDRVTEISLWKKFHKLYGDRQQEHEKFVADKRTTHPAAAEAYITGIGFESLYDFILAHYPAYVDSKLQQKDQGLAPQVLWKALNGQFTNCTLDRVTVEMFKPTVTPLHKLPNRGQTLEDYLWEKVKERRDTSTEDFTSLHGAIEQVLRYLHHDTESTVEPYAYWSHSNATIKELYDQTPKVTKAVVDAASRLLEDSRVAKKRVPEKEVFQELLRTAKTGSDCTLVEAEYAHTYQTLWNCVQSIVDHAQADGEFIYLRDPISKHVEDPPVVRRLFGELTDALGKLDQVDTKLKNRAIYMTGFSKDPGLPDQEKYTRVAHTLIKSHFGLMGSHVKRNNNGSAKAYGKGVPHYAVNRLALGF